MPTGIARLAFIALLVTLLVAASCGSPPHAAVQRDAAVQRQPDAARPDAGSQPDLERLVSIRDGRSGAALSFDELLDAAAEADVVFLGESHTDETTHRVELAVYEGLLARRDARVVLALEMFERDAQPALDDYLAGRRDEDAFLADARPWGNYATAYRPLIEAARRAGAPVVASNIPRPVRQSLAGAGGSLDGLPPDERHLAPAELLPNTPLYWRRADNAIRGHRAMMAPAGAGATAGQPAAPTPSPEEDAASAERLNSTQSLWDNAMGESCALALERHPGHVVCHVNGGFHSQYWDGTVRQLRLRVPDARVVTIAIVPVDSPGSAELRGIPEADYVVFAERRADDPRDGEGTVWVQRGLNFRLHLPAAATDGARVPLLIWLPDDGTTAEESLALWTLRLGDDAAIAVLEPADVETQEDLAPGGRWFAADRFDEDVGAAATAVERLWSYLVERLPVDRERVCLAGEGTGATAVVAAALFADRLAAEAVAIAPSRYARLRDLALPLPELRGDDPRPDVSLSVLADEAPGPGGDSPAAWWRDELAEYAGVDLPAKLAPIVEQPQLQRLQVVNVVRAALGLAPEPPRGDMVAMSYVLVASGSPRERLWSRMAAERQGHIPVVDVPPTVEGMTPLELDVRAEDFAADDALPVCPGPFGGTTLLVLPAGTPADEIAAWKALVENDPLTRQNRFTRLRVAVDGGEPDDALAAVLAKLESENRRNVLIAPAAFYADGEAMRALRRQARDFEERMTLHWRPGLGGR